MRELSESSESTGMGSVEPELDNVLEREGDVDMDTESRGGREQQVRGHGGDVPVAGHRAAAVGVIMQAEKPELG